MKLKKHPIYKAIFKRFKSQAKKGVSKYGALVQSDNLTHQEWLEHAAEELTDLLVYIECAKETDGDTASKAIVKLKEKSDRIAELEKVLDFYAQKENYAFGGQSKATKDFGQLARKVLGHTEED